MIDFTPSPELYPFESKWFESSVGKVHYIDEGSGRPILFLHGNPTWSFLYRGIVSRLKGQFRCVAIDYPGFGLSVHPDGYGYTAKEHAGIVGELVDHLELQDMIVMGQDWGGPIGTSVAIERKDRVSGMVIGNSWAWKMNRMMTRVFSPLMTSPPIQWAILNRNFFVERLIPAGLTRKLSKEEMDHYRGVQPDRAARKGVAEFPRELIAAGPWLQEIEAGLPALGDKPLLLVWGMKDFAFSPKAFIPKWKSYFKDSVLVKLPKARHFIQEDAPEEIAKAIAERFG
ncbi:MAG: alpha/beta fold hydrolase [Chloroflexi bacterium]|nr:alpha/beta fold hydrolase [Chloroflexota bacterium]